MSKIIVIVLVVALCSPLLMAASDAYAPLALYEGSWTLKKNAAGTEAKPENIVNHCTRLGPYFMCEQVVNGGESNLIVFIPREQAGQYYTQAITKEGKAAGRGDLVIDGNRWTYSGKGEQGGKTTYYRTVNVFTGRDHIHYEQAESSDGEHWTVTASGDEARSGA
jgi:hypothetical protein